MVLHTKLADNFCQLQKDNGVITFTVKGHWATTNLRTKSSPTISGVIAMFRI